MTRIMTEIHNAYDAQRANQYIRRCVVAGYHLGYEVGCHSDDGDQRYHLQYPDNLEGTPKSACVRSSHLEESVGGESGEEKLKSTGS